MSPNTLINPQPKGPATNDLLQCGRNPEVPQGPIGFFLMTCQLMSASNRFLLAFPAHLPSSITLSRRRSKGFLILLVTLWIFLIVAVYGTWEDLGAWKILLRYVPMICLQF